MVRVPDREKNDDFVLFLPVELSQTKQASQKELKWNELAQERLRFRRGVLCDLCEGSAALGDCAEFSGFSSTMETWEQNACASTCDWE
jgi:hypothetical protein